MARVAAGASRGARCPDAAGRTVWDGGRARGPHLSRRAAAPGAAAEAGRAVRVRRRDRSGAALRVRHEGAAGVARLRRDAARLGCARPSERLRCNRAASRCRRASCCSTSRCTRPATGPRSPSPCVRPASSRPETTICSTAGRWSDPDERRTKNEERRTRTGNEELRTTSSIVTRSMFGRSVPGSVRPFRSAFFVLCSSSSFFVLRSSFDDDPRRRRRRGWLDGGDLRRRRRGARAGHRTHARRRPQDPDQRGRTLQRAAVSRHAGTIRHRLPGASHARHAAIVAAGAATGVLRG